MTENKTPGSQLDTQIDTPVISLDHLRVEFETDGGTVVAVNDISFKVSSFLDDGFGWRKWFWKICYISFPHAAR